MALISLHLLALASLLVGFASALVITIDVTRHPQRMWIMNVVWPISALFGGPLWLWGFFAYGQLAAKDREKEDTKNTIPFPVMVAKGASHCGSGCTLGDICAEWAAFLFPALATWFGWRTIFGEKMFAVWVFDYLVAFVFGISFQYFTIVPMRGLSPLSGLWAAVKADVLSLTAWQVGMYGFMAMAKFVLFQRLLGIDLAVNTPEFWFMMQIAMLCGFATSYPVNWWLLRSGIKEKM